MKRRSALALLLGLAAGLTLAAPASAEMDEAARQSRWDELRHAIFGDHAVKDGADVVRIEAADRAEDAAIVPVTIALATPIQKRVRNLYFVIDDNPSPLAAVFRFGAAAEARSVATRVRIDDYTYMHAVAELDDGTLYSSRRFIKAAGGCSAPAAADQEAALARLGKMKLAFQGTPQLGSPVTAQLLISHPNSSGLQMDQVTRNYIPANFIQQVRVTYAGEPVLTVDSDIALSEDPSIRFAFVPKKPGELRVEADDNNQRHFTQHWPFPAATD
ncbi:MAG TPA: quinoprotein dehydrogenase-associated SoxYZ-like carrier [Stellaceae bacterium]|nr:quinoprotein dehydrogenase-associated SoxYZ-like carrier [Stellaceae bacterium]